MKNYGQLIILFFMSLTMTSAAQLTKDSTQSTMNNTGEWLNLFNGKDLEGWEVKTKSKDKEKVFWSVENGTITCNSINSTDHGYVWLLNKQEFSNFELRLKFQVSRQHTGNSGVQFRSRYDDKSIVEDGEPGWLDGPQADIEPNSPWRNGLIYDETRGVKRWIYPSLPDWKISENEKEVPKKVIFYFEDEGDGWNSMTIICDKMHITVIVNNIVVTDYDASDVLMDEIHKKYKVSTSGYIALQLHKASQNLIRFKDIEIREMVAN